MEKNLAAVKKKNSTPMDVASPVPVESGGVTLDFYGFRHPSPKPITLFVHYGHAVLCDLVVIVLQVVAYRGGGAVMLFEAHSQLPLRFTNINLLTIITSYPIYAACLVQGFYFVLGVDQALAYSVKRSGVHCNAGFPDVSGNRLRHRTHVR